MPSKPSNSESALRPITNLERKSSHVAGLLLALFLAGGIGTTVIATLSHSLNLEPKTSSWSAFLNGDISQGIANDLANAPFPEAAAKLERGFSWIVANDLGPRVRRGSDDWLFLADEFNANQDAQLNAISRADEVLEIGRNLSNKGIELLVVVVPDKGRIAYPHLGDLKRSAQSTNRVQEWVAYLKRSNLPAINLTDTLNALESSNGSSFLRTDTHWSEQGAEVSALEVAIKIQQMGIKPSPKKIISVTNKTNPIRPGDLVHLAGIDWLPNGLQPKIETAQKSEFLIKDIPASKNFSNNVDDLFGDELIPNIAVIGTSFSRTSHFIEFLETDLQSLVGNFAIDGGDFSGSAHAYFKSPSFKETPPKLIIWEIPERVIQSSRAKDKALKI